MLPDMIRLSHTLRASKVHIFWHRTRSNALSGGAAITGCKSPLRLSDPLRGYRIICRIRTVFSAHLNPGSIVATADRLVILRGHRPLSPNSENNLAVLVRQPSSKTRRSCRGSAARSEMPMSFAILEGRQRNRTRRS